MSLVFKYGDYVFNPKPLFNISMSPLKTPDGLGYGKNYTISLEGDLINTGNQIDSGIFSLFNKINALNDAFNKDGKLLLISCDTSGIILSGYPIIQNLNIEKQADNYTRQVKYTAELNMPTLIHGGSGDKFNNSGAPPYIESCNETWDVSFEDSRLPISWAIVSGNGAMLEKFGYKIAVTHSVDVQAKLAYNNNGIHKEPWKEAKDYATSKLGFKNEFFTLSGILNLPGSTYFTKYDVFNNYRQVSVDKTSGNIKVTETFIVSPSGQNSLPNNAIETFEISTQQNEGVVTVDIQGNIEGLAKISYTGGAETINGPLNAFVINHNSNGFFVKKDKFSAASGYFNKIKNRLYARANTAYLAVDDKCYKARKLNPLVKQKTVGLNPIQGTISYSYQYDNSPIGCISGDCILSRTITVDDSYPHDLYASQIILGRSTGPILQDLNTISNATRSVNIEVVTIPPTACDSMQEIYKPVPTGQIHDFISMISGDLMDNYDQVFIESSSQSWNFTNGRYTRSIAFAYINCN